MKVITNYISIHVEQISEISCRLREISANLTLLQETLYHNPGCESYYVIAVRGLENSLSKQTELLEQIVSVSEQEGLA